MDSLRQPPIVSAAFLERFEQGLDPQRPEASRIPARILGYGEISSILAIRGLEGVALKRLPIFTSPSEAESYARMFHAYSRHLADAGLTLPGQTTAAVPSPGAAACPAFRPPADTPRGT